MHEYDLVIRGGTVFDGSGGEPFAADVAVRDGCIASVGRVAGSGREEIDARDRLVTPGFVDVHTHYDGQITWADRLTPSSWHGLTTALMGNCGVGFAPCKPNEHDQLIGLMEGVEDIPGDVLTSGLPWGWETFGEYLDALERRHADMDFGTQVPHGPVRAYVMGKRGAAREPATPDDIVQMAAIVRDGIAAGALGFSSSRTLLHRTRDGELAPETTASEGELIGIAGAMRGGVLEMVEDFFDSSDAPAPSFEIWRRVVAASGRPLSFIVTAREKQPDRWRHLLAYIASANAQGLPIKGQVCARPIGLLFGLDCSFHPFTTCPTYRGLAPLSLAERVRELCKPEVRARILAESPGDPDLLVPEQTQNFERMYPFGDPPEYCPAAEMRIAERARRLGVRPQEVAYDALLERDGHAMLYYPSNNFQDGTLDIVLAMLKDENTVLGVGDGGAHVGMVCDASFPTHVLTYWTRDRKGERLPLPRAIAMLARDTAELIGLHDRGVIAPGYKADLNVIDYDGMRLHAPHVVHDLPAAGRRIVQGADGYVASVVSGAITYRDGAPTGALPGRLVRGGQPAPL